MIFHKNKSHPGTGENSEPSMSDSLRAAQIIFQKHSDAGQAVTPTTNTPPSHKRSTSAQSTPAKSAASAVRNRAVTPPPIGTSQNNLKGHATSPPSEHAHLAAALAHALMNPEAEEELSHSAPIEYDRLSPVVAKQKQPQLASHPISGQHLAHLYRAPSSRNSSNCNVSTSNNGSVTSLEELPKLDVSRDLSSMMKGTPTKQLPPSAPKQVHKSASEQPLQTPIIRTPIDSQKQQSLPSHRGPAEQIKQQLKESYRQPAEQAKQQVHTVNSPPRSPPRSSPRSPPRSPPMRRELSLPTQVSTKALPMQTPQQLQLQQNLQQQQQQQQQQKSHQQHQQQQHHQPQQQQNKQTEEPSSQPRPDFRAHPYSSPAEFSGLDAQMSAMSPATSNGPQSQPGGSHKPISRDLTRRIPPPRIYLGSSGDDETATDSVVENEGDLVSDRPILRARIKRRIRPPIDESSSSVISSDSPVSYGMENSSWDDRRLEDTDNYVEDPEEDDDYFDENNIIDDDDDDDEYDDYYDDEIDDEYNEKEYSLPPRGDGSSYDRYDFPETSSLPNLDNGSSTLAPTYSAAAFPGANLVPDRYKQGQPTRSYTQNAGRIPHQPNVTYQGTLPDLIPNHIRRTKMEKLRNKIFGSRSSKKKPHSPFDFSGDRTSVTSDPEGRPLVKTNQNMRFKTTMRKDPYEGSLGDNHGTEKGGDNDEYGRNDYDLEDSDEDSDSSIEVREEKHKHRGKAIRKKLKHTAAVVPYSHHLPHMDTRHTPKIFNEDKPWKSHNDVGFVTSQERKRYEGMWVSNRCTYLDLLPWWDAVLDGDSDINVQLPEDGLMLNLVVKDIWSRSNLSNELLSQIYDMVDTRGDGTLDRKSFVVGMWLVDQCLYGRKLPKEIDHKVWSSVDKYVVSTINSANLKQLDRSRKKLMKQELKNIKKEIKNVHL